VDTLKNMNVLNGIQREEIAYFLIGPKIVLEWPSFVAIVKSWMTTVKDKLEKYFCFLIFPYGKRNNRF
jgi:hypothetical protein